MMKDKTIIISGGMGLLGKEWAKYLSNLGANVIVVDLEDKITEGYDNGFFCNNNEVGYCLDITDEEKVINFMNYIKYMYGNIDIIINAVAINPQPKEGEDNSFENYSLERWKKTIDVNLTGTFVMCKAACKIMKKQYRENPDRRGTIINVASDLALIAPDQRIYNDWNKPCDYGVSKAGIINLTKYIAAYYSNVIKCVCLVPGSVYNGQDPKFVSTLEDKISLGRMARIDEYNGAIKFLCSSDSDYMHGSGLVMTGGRHIW